MFFIVYKLPSSQEIPLVMSQCYVHICFYTVPVTDTTAAAASSSQPSTTTLTAEEPLSHVVGRYIYILYQYSVEIDDGKIYSSVHVLLVFKQ